MTAYAICDTSGGRTPPRVLLGHLYDSEQRAIDDRQYLGYNPQWYPIRLVTIVIDDAPLLNGAPT